jgi:hypothetical protein
MPASFRLYGAQRNIVEPKRRQTPDGNGPVKAGNHKKYKKGAFVGPGVIWRPHNSVWLIAKLRLCAKSSD